MALYNRLSIIYILSLTLVSLLSGCSSQAKLEKKADLTFDMGEYYRAADLYERIIEKTKNEVKLSERLYKAANCYRLMNEPKKAARYYQKSIRKKNRNPLLFLYLAEQKRKLGLYDEALPFYEQFKQMQPDDERADIGIKSCAVAKEWLMKPTRYNISPMKAINTKTNEYCPAYANDDFTLLYYTTSRESENSKKINPASGVVFTDVWTSRQERTGVWNAPVVLEDTLINSQWDDGACVFTKDKKSMLFTTCKREQGKNLGCQIYEAQMRGGDWTKASRLSIVADTITIGHPSIAANGLSLYFSADLEGGVGGNDIWMCQRESSSANWSKPENLGTAINTPGDELFPFIREDGTLYFSSDYRVGMGGLDIFRAVRNEDGSWACDNMQAPINSPADDFGIVFQGKKEIGLFSSSREEGKGGDDIFEFELPELEFWAQGKLIDKSTKKPLANGLITLYGSDGSVIEQKARADGSYKFKLKQYTEYLILGAAPDYLKKKIKFSTNNVFDNKTFDETIALVTTTKPVEIPNIFYDFGKFELNESSKDALIELAKILEDNPNITIELGSHTDMVGDSLKNMELSMKRARSVITYLKSKGYDPERLIAKGYGESRPVVVDENVAAENPGFRIGDTLHDKFILALPAKDIQDKANQINRRTELRILSSNYIPKPEYFIQFKSKKKNVMN